MKRPRRKNDNGLAPYKHLYKLSLPNYFRIFEMCKKKVGNSALIRPAS